MSDRNLTVASSTEGGLRGAEMISEWHAHIRGALSFTVAQDRMEEALAAGVDFAALLALPPRAGG